MAKYNKKDLPHKEVGKHKYFVYNLVAKLNVQEVFLMLNTILTEETITFKAMEEKVFRFSMEMGRMILQKILEEQAEIIDSSRDKSIYRNKGNRKTVIKTKMGEVEYERPLYLVSEEKQKETGKKSIYLLDQALEINKFGKVSENLVDVMIANINELSYRKTAENISGLTRTSHKRYGCLECNTKHR